MQIEKGYEPSPSAHSPDALIRAPIRQWFTQQKWQAAYNLWQESRLCRSGFGEKENSVCTQTAIPLPANDQCQGTQDGYEFLVMHRYLLQAVRSLWPQLEDPFAGWSQFPTAEDYPPFLQPRFYAWPNGILEKVPNLSGGSAQVHGTEILSDENATSLREQWLQRWKSEGELGQWLQCGASKNGLNIDSLYGALMTNAISSGNHPMDLYLFWKAHGWIDRVWEDYRRATGKTPDDPELQAALIQQCRIHQSWAKKVAGLSAPVPAATPEVFLFKDSELNPRQTGKTHRLIGEVVDIQKGPQDKTFIKIDVRRVGVKPVWVSSYAPFAEGLLKLGATYEFVGSVAQADALDSNGQLRKFLRSPTLLLVKSLQSPK